MNYLLNIDVKPTLVCDAVPALYQNWFNVSCLQQGGKHRVVKKRRGRWANNDPTLDKIKIHMILCFFSANGQYCPAMLRNVTRVEFIDR